MIILDKQYVSRELKDFLVRTQEPVLCNAAARQADAEGRLNIVDEAEARALLKAGERVYTTCENSLAWVLANSTDENLVRGIRLFKDKAAFRRALAARTPDFFFREYSFEELTTVEVESLPLPVVLKPSVGFFSFGVHVIFQKSDWDRALEEIRSQSASWNEIYDRCVVDDGTFLVEQYIGGEEYAVDFYYDGDGRAVILNIFRHEFPSADNVGDRLYCTGASILREHLVPFTEFCNRMNLDVGARNMPVHLELRVEKGLIQPIEANPMRFAGWCLNEIALYAYGFLPYEYFLRGERPEWDVLLAGRENKVYSFALLDPPANMAGKRFDYERFCSSFKKVLGLRRIESGRPVYGFVFLETDLRDHSELERLLHTDFREYIS